MSLAIPKKGPPNKKAFHCNQKKARARHAIAVKTFQPVISGV
jgi:hypothetical protein